MNDRVSPPTPSISLFYKVLRIEPSLFCKIMILKGVGGDSPNILFYYVGNILLLQYNFFCRFLGGLFLSFACIPYINFEDESGHGTMISSGNISKGLLYHVGRRTLIALCILLYIGMVTFALLIFYLEPEYDCQVSYYFTHCTWQDVEPKNMCAKKMVQVFW